MKFVKDRKIKIGVIGCGRISSNHFKAIKEYSNDLDLVSVCDLSKSLLENEEFSNINRYTSCKEMFESENLDLVSICTPSGVHPAQAVMAASYGVNVITEKPMATRWQDGLDMVSACDKNQVRLFVVKQNRRNSTLQLLKRAVDEGRFGRINMVQINVFWTRPQEYYDSAKWRGTWELDGGALMNQASHYIDLIDWLVGPVQSIQAMTATREREIEVEDTAVLNIKWRTGALGSVAVTMLTYPQNLEGSVTILGSKGTARVGGKAVNEIQNWVFSDQKDYDKTVQDANYETTSVYGFGHPLYYKNVIDVMRGKAEAETDGREGLKSLEILIASYLSARDGKMVSLPLQY